MQPGRGPADAPAGLIQRDAGLGPDHRFAVLIGGRTPRRAARERLAQAPRRQGQAKPALPHRDRLPVGEPELLVQDRREGQGLGAALRGRCPGRLRRLAGMPALDSGAARDTVADVDPKPRHVDAPADRCLVLVLDPLGRDRPVTRRAARRQPRIDLVVHLRRDLPAPLRPVLGPALPAGSLRGRFRLALGERRRLALPRPLRRGQFLREPISLWLESVPLLAAVRRTLLQTRNLRVLLLDVSSQPPDLGLQVFDPFPHGQADHSHPRYDSRGEGFCPVAFDGVPVSAASDPLNNYHERCASEIQQVVRHAEREPHGAAACDRPERVGAHAEAAKIPLVGGGDPYFIGPRG